MTETVESVLACHAFMICRRESWSISRYKNPETGEMFVASGQNMPETANLTYRLYGQWKTNSRGKRFEVAYSELVFPETEDGVVAYLSSLKIGIGKAKAIRIYREFEDEIWDVLENTPERVTEVRGISKEITDKLIKKLKETRQLRIVIEAFKGFCDINPQKANAVISYFGEYAERVVKTMPYELCQLPAFPFPSVDEMALANGGAKDAPARLEAAAVYAVAAQSAAGHVCVPFEEVLREMQKIL